MRHLRWQALIAILGMILVGGLLAGQGQRVAVEQRPERGGVYIEALVGAPPPPTPPRPPWGGGPGPLILRGVGALPPPRPPRARPRQLEHLGRPDHLHLRPQAH